MLQNNDSADSFFLNNIPVFNGIYFHKIKEGKIMNSVLELAGVVVALIVALVFQFILPGSGAEAIVVLVAGSIFTYFGWDWRIKYLEVKNWMASKTLWAIALAAIPMIGFLLGAAGIINIEEIVIFGFPLQLIFEWLAGIGGGGFILGAGHAKIKKENLRKVA